MTEDEGTRLWLPPLTLAGCARAVMLRDTRGRALDAVQRENYFPANLCRETRRLTGFSPEELRCRMRNEEAFWPYRLWR